MHLFEVQLAGMPVEPQIALRLVDEFELPSLKYAVHSDGETSRYLEWGTPSVLMTADQLAVWCVRMDRALNVVSAKRIPSAAAGLSDVANYQGERKTGPEFNGKVQVAVGGNALMQVDEVQLEQDCCTDTLNNMLADGWRILAVCVQPDQRRPDYVLGRVSKS